MRRAGRAVLGLLGGFAVTAAGGIALAELADISQAEGAYMMGLFFVWAPLGGCVGALVALLWPARRG